MSLTVNFNPNTISLLIHWALGQKFTPDYKDKKIETEKTNTYNTPFLSLKCPDFKYVIFKIVEVSPRNPPAEQHSQFGLIPPNWAESAVLLSWWISQRYLYDFKNYIFEIRKFQGLK